MSSRGKGSENERAVAHMMAKWWGRLEPDCKWVRTPLSGGWGGPTLRASFKASGDLMTTAELFPFSVEVKRREGWKEENLLLGRKSPVWTWWHQACDQAVEMSVEPLMLFRRNRKPWWLMIPTVTTNRVSEFHDLDSLTVSEWTNDQIERHVRPGDWYPVIVLAEEFFDRVDPISCLIQST